MIFKNTSSITDPIRLSFIAAYRSDETTCINNMLSQINLTDAAYNRIYQDAETLVQNTRKRRLDQGGLERFLHQYDLSSEEGIALMCLAEALLRIPDKLTIDKLISDKLSTAAWSKHLGASSSLFVNAATWSMLLTGKLYEPTLQTEASLSNTLLRLVNRAGGAFVRPIIKQGMKIIGKQYVMGRTIEEALKRATILEAKGYRYSYDMLGEAARTAQDAERYYQSYLQAIHAIGKAATTQDPRLNPGISVKLSALHPRYEYSQKERVLNELVPRLLTLVLEAKKYALGITVDAEEADRLELSLDIIERVFTDPRLEGFEGFGLAVQSYQKRAPFVIDFLTRLAQQQKRRFMVRLIKGAYWDAEIKQSQMLGLEGYPVYTRKNGTDTSFLACAQKLLAHPECFYPQFGSHNAYSVAAILEMAGSRTDFEFQCLHGMGQTLYDNIVGAGNKNVPCRIYAPVGNHKELLSYLVRRLLENGANSSFINQIADTNMPLQELLKNPVARMQRLASKPHPHIPLPAFIFGHRLNSKGFDMSNTIALLDLQKAMLAQDQKTWLAAPIVFNKTISDKNGLPVKSPSFTDRIVGHVVEATADDVESALAAAAKACTSWAKTPVDDRAACLERLADLLESARPELLTLLCREAGKHLGDSISEIREAVDFCRYYAERARLDLAPETLTGPTGEYNELSLHPRGTFVCISPWNFPLAIFAGQVVAALVAGNPVIAKPAEQTPLIAALTVRFMHEAGIPKDVIQLLPGRGETVGAKLVADTRVAGVMFTGSTEVAKIIQQTLANRPGPIVPLIAETGGQNAMIVDSSALPEQVVADVVQSAFNSAGQRCSALRVLFLQEDVADNIIEMLKGAMAELRVGDPSLLETDIGPVIDADALKLLEDHAKRLTDAGKLLYQLPKPTMLNAHFFAPCVFELKNLNELAREVFGPILHIIRFKASELDHVLDEIIASGYGLTLGIHSRIQATVQHIRERMPVGNLYVNRNIIGAVVGVQPFGGEGMSGTGPKAGGPHYLPRLCVERAISINTTAAGGNTTLVSLKEED